MNAKAKKDLTKAEVTQLIAKAVRSTHSMQKAVQKAVVELIMLGGRKPEESQFVIDTANAMLVDMSAGVRKQGLFNWFNEIGGLSFDPETNLFVSFAGPEFVKAMAEKIRETTWHDYKLPPQEWGGLVVWDKLDSIIKQDDKAKARIEKDASLADKYQPEDEILNMIRLVKKYGTVEAAIAQVTASRQANDSDALDAELIAELKQA